jgi:hypothetical protein
MTPPSSGQPLTPEEEHLLQQMERHWQQVWNEAPKEAIGRIEEAARQIITITASLQALYPVLFVFSTIRAQITQLSASVPSWLVLLPFFLPPGCWLISLALATRVFLPRVQPGVNLNEISPGAWQKVKDAYARTSEAKLQALQHAHFWLLISFGAVLLSVVIFVLLPAPPG